MSFLKKFLPKPTKVQMPENIVKHKYELGFKTGIENVLCGLRTVNNQKIFNVVSFEPTGILLMSIQYLPLDFAKPDIFINQELIQKIEIKPHLFQTHLFIQTPQHDYDFDFPHNNLQPDYQIQNVKRLDQLIKQYQNHKGSDKS